MTKVELVKRIVVVTRPDNRDCRTEGIIMDCIDAFAETLLLQVRHQTETALEKVITDTMRLLAETRHQGRGDR